VVPANVIVGGSGGTGEVVPATVTGGSGGTGEVVPAEADWNVAHNASAQAKTTATNERLVTDLSSWDLQLRREEKRNKKGEPPLEGSPRRYSATLSAGGGREFLGKMEGRNHNESV
jgi:hypothetical protein